MFYVYIREMDKIIKKYEIRKNNHLFNLEDIVKKIIGSKSPVTYINKIQDKQRINSHYYITQIKFLELLSKSKSKKCKEALKMIQDEQDIDKPVSNQIALIDNKLTFEGTNFYYFKGDSDNIWFKGKDIASILGYKDKDQSIRDHIDDYDKLSFKNLTPVILTGMNGKNEIKSSNFNFKESTIFINESGLYSIILSSKLEKAKRFKRWVTSEVLPSIRKNGKYEIPKPDVKELPDLNKYIDKNCLYLIHIKDNIYKYGITRKIIDRMNRHKRDLDYNNTIKIWVADTRETIENMISNLLTQWNIKIVYQKKTECFQTTNDITIDHVIEKIDEYINEHQGETISDEITKLNLQVKLKELEIKHDQIKQEEKKHDIKEKELNMLYELVGDQKDRYRDRILSKYFGIDNAELIENKKIESKFIINNSTNESDDDTIYDESSESEEEHENSECIDCGTSISKQATRCLKCLGKLRFEDAVKERPSLKKLKEQVVKHGYTGTGRIHNVSDNTIRKWIKKYEMHNLLLN